MVLLHNRLHSHSRISFATPSDSSFHDVRSSMRLGLTRNLPLKRSFADYSITSGSRQQQLKFPATMAAKSEILVEISPEEETDKVEDKKEEDVLLPPPPPEKPEPGDCCGSGCVRCVWDVYYEELEEYNNKLSSSSISGENKSH